MDKMKQDIIEGNIDITITRWLSALILFAPISLRVKLKLLIQKSIYNFTAIKSESNRR